MTTRMKYLLIAIVFSVIVWIAAIAGFAELLRFVTRYL